MDSILVTGGAGFIGSNLVRRALATTAGPRRRPRQAHLRRQPASLDDVAERDPRFALRARRHRRPRARSTRVFREHRPRAVLNLAAETHVDRSIDGPRPFVRHQHRRARSSCSRRRAATSRRRDAAGRARRAASAFRFLHVSTDEVFGTLGADGLVHARTTPYAPNSPYSASKAAADHLVRAYHHTFGLPALVTNCSNNYGPYQFPEKLIPLMILNARRGQAAADLRRRRQRARLALRRGPLRRAARGARARRARRELQPRRRTASAPTSRSCDALCALLEELLPAARNPAMRARGLAAYAALETLRRRPAGPRPPLRDRRRRRSAASWLGAAHRPRRRAARRPCAGTSTTATWCEAVQGARLPPRAAGARALDGRDEGHHPRRRHRHAALPGDAARSASSWCRSTTSR